MAPTFNSTITAAENVSSPLVYLPPHVAHQISIVIYIHIGTTAVLIWDFLNNLRNDYKLLFFFKFGIPSFLYFASRLCLLVYGLARAVLLTVPVGRCTTLARTINVLPVAFVILTTLLFYIRVSAIYNRDRFIIAFFGITWLAAAGMSSTFYITISAENLGPTYYCIETMRDLHHLLAATAVVFLVNDALLYFAIVWRVYLMFLDCSEASLIEKFKTIVCGTSLPILSKVILLDSQIYFLLIVAMKVFLLFAMTHLQPPFNVTLIICHLVLVNILAYRVYRSLKMGLHNEKEMKSIVIDINFTNPTQTVQSDKQPGFTFGVGDSSSGSNSNSVEGSSVSLGR